MLTLTLWYPSISAQIDRDHSHTHFLHFLACDVPIPLFPSDCRPISSSSTTLDQGSRMRVTVHLSAQSFKSRKRTKKNPVTQDEHAKITLQGQASSYGSEINLPDMSGKSLVPSV